MEKKNSLFDAVKARITPKSSVPSRESSSVSKAMTSDKGSSKEELDFDEEGRKLLAGLNLETGSTSSKGTSRSSPSFWNPCDPIFRHAIGGGTIFVGNQSFAQNYTALKHHGVTHIVNCTYGVSKIPNFHEDKISYLEFPISHWQSFIRSSDPAQMIEFVTPLFTFIESAIRQGGNVLVHCLAGAHRAGTTGCACLIYFANMDAPTAIRTAKHLRPIIDPIGQLPEFLRKLKAALDAIGFEYDPEEQPYLPSIKN